MYAVLRVCPSPPPRLSRLGPSELVLLFSSSRSLPVSSQVLNSCSGMYGFHSLLAASSLSAFAAVSLDSTWTPGQTLRSHHPYYLGPVDLDSRGFKLTSGCTWFLILLESFLPFSLLASVELVALELRIYCSCTRLSTRWQLTPRASD